MWNSHLGEIDTKIKLNPKLNNYFQIYLWRCAPIRLYCLISFVCVYWTVICPYGVTLQIIATISTWWITIPAIDSLRNFSLRYFSPYWFWSDGVKLKLDLSLQFPDPGVPLHLGPCATGDPLIPLAASFSAMSHFWCYDGWLTKSRIGSARCCDCCV